MSVKPDDFKKPEETNAILYDEQQARKSSLVMKFHEKLLLKISEISEKTSVGKQSCSTIPVSNSTWFVKIMAEFKSRTLTFQKKSLLFASMIALQK